jgi:hypothetical protein
LAIAKRALGDGNCYQAVLDAVRLEPLHFIPTFLVGSDGAWGRAMIVRLDAVTLLLTFMRADLHLETKKCWTFVGRLRCRKFNEIN